MGGGAESSRLQRREIAAVRSCVGTGDPSLPGYSARAAGAATAAITTTSATASTVAEAATALAAITAWRFRRTAET